MADGNVSTDHQAVVVAWIETHVGPIRSITREGRWRPAWYVEAEKDGKPVQLYVRGDRGGRWPPLPLAYEAKVHQVFIDAGLKVPELYGYIDSVPAMVMERVPGRPNIALAENEEARDRLREQLADQMRLMHQVDPAAIASAGSPVPTTARETALNHYRQAEALYLTGDRAPSPDIEFVRGWLDRNMRPTPEAPVVIAMDAGQFIFEGDELTAMLDFEFVVVGDRHVDFAALRSRTQFELIGDLPEFYKLYEARGGAPVDVEQVAYQKATFVMYAPFEVAHELVHPNPDADFHEYMRWHTGGPFTALIDIAEILKIELEPYVPPPVRPSRYALALQAVEGALATLPADQEFARYRIDKLGDAVRWLTRHEGRRTAMEREYLDDVEALTGARPTDEWDADTRLEAFVHAAGPEQDETLIRLLHRRGQRMMVLLAEDEAQAHPAENQP